jgi:hypothetical protein
VPAPVDGAGASAYASGTSKWASRSSKAGEQQLPGEHRAAAVEEHVQRPECRAEEPGGWHADHRVAGHHREVGHERQLEPADVKERTE